MYGYIYKTTNLINGLIYIGQHKATKFEPTKYIGSGRHLKAAIKEFGKENFICEFLDAAETLEELNDKEDYWVNFYNSRDPRIGYNVKKGGEQLGLTGCCKIKHGEETLIVERTSVDSYLAEGWNLTNTEETRKEKSKIYQKRYYEKNKEKLLAKGKTWRDNNKERVKELQTAWEHEHSEEGRTKSLQYYYDHREERLEYSKKHKAEKSEYSKEHYELNKNKYIENATQWRKKNPEKYKEACKKYREKKKQKNKTKTD